MGFREASLYVLVVLSSASGCSGGSGTKSDGGLGGAPGGTDGAAGGSRIAAEGGADTIDGARDVADQDVATADATNDGARDVADQDVATVDAATDGTRDVADQDVATADAIDASASEEAGDGSSDSDSGGPVKDGLVAYFPFDGDTTDYSGNGNSGISHGSIHFESGVVGNAVAFNGDMANYISIANSPSLQFQNAVTMAFWLKLNSRAGQTGSDCSRATIASAHQAIISKSNHRVGFTVAYWGQTSPPTLGAIMGDTSRAMSSADQIEGQWIHIAVVIAADGSRVYIDGALAAVDTLPTDFAIANGEDMFIGLMGGKTSCLPWWYPLNGELDELRIYSRSLTEADITTLASGMP
jgi:hypothetical protein